MWAALDGSEQAQARSRMAVTCTGLVEGHQVTGCGYVNSLITGNCGKSSFSTSAQAS